MLSATVGGPAVGRCRHRLGPGRSPRLRYETWYYLHFYTYLAVALAFSHQFADGAQFIMQHRRPRRLVRAVHRRRGGLVWFRFVTPVRQAFRHRLRVVAVMPEAPGVVCVLIRGRHLDELRAEPGQFFRWRFLARGLWWASSPYSLSAPPHGDLLRITVKAARGPQPGAASAAAGHPGGRRGPVRRVTAAVRRRRKVLLIAGGVGITPMRALFEALPPATSP